jgi:hypothetical protein
MAMAERVIAGKAVEDGVLLVCTCGHETHLVTLQRDDEGNLIPTPLEQAYTCQGCGTSHWLTLGIKTD